MISVLVSFFLFTGIGAFGRLFFQYGFVSARQFKRILQWSLVLMLILPLVRLISLPESDFQFGFQKWIPVVENSTLFPAPQKLSVPPLSQTELKQEQTRTLEVGDALAVLLFAGGLMYLGRLLFEIFRFRKLLKASVLLRRYKNIQIYLNPQIASAFCCGVFRGKIFLPPSQYFSPVERTVVLAHEFSHLKVKDPFWTLCMELVKDLFVFTGIAWLWRNWYLLASEIECDQRAILRLGLHKKDYFRFLLKQIETTRTPFGANGASVSYQHMKRRIQMHHFSRTKKVFGVLFGSLLLACAGAGAAVHLSQTTGSHWSVDDLRRLMDNKPNQVQMVYHKAVAKELTRFLSSADTKRKIRKAFARMKPFEAEFKAHLISKTLPEDYVLLPLIESGYQNIESVTNRSGGMWQFIPETARRYGLKVDEDNDERFDIQKSTAAAADYLKFLNGLFKDSRLALLSYNLGESALRKMLKETSAKTIEDLLDSGELENEQRQHVARFQAALVLYYNPELLK
jgi:beta-lactamase regulating signal transducer with metallopeptidase domain